MDSGVRGGPGRCPARQEPQWNGAGFYVVRETCRRISKAQAPRTHLPMRQYPTPNGGAWGEIRGFRQPATGKSHNPAIPGGKEFLETPKNRFTAGTYLQRKSLSCISMLHSSQASTTAVAVIFDQARPYLSRRPRSYAVSTTAVAVISIKNSGMARACTPSKVLAGRCSGSK